MARSRTNGQATTVGVISDTHGLLRPEALAKLADVDLILHAGDIGSPDVVPRLVEIAPVIAVRGNVDTDPWAEEFPEMIGVDVGGLTLFVIHDRNVLPLEPANEGYAAVINGHSHKPVNEKTNGVLWFNPGSAGPRRFRLPISLGKLYVSGGEIRSELITLG